MDGSGLSRSTSLSPVAFFLPFFLPREFKLRSNLKIIRDELELLRNFQLRLARQEKGEEKCYEGGGDILSKVRILQDDMGGVRPC